MHTYDFLECKCKHDVIQANLRTLIRYGDAKYRDAFHQIAYASLRAKKMRCMKFRDFVLYPGKGVVHIRARQVVVGKLCPQCDAPLKYENLRTLQLAEEGQEKDLVVWGCVLCGRVFSRWESNKEACQDEESRPSL